MNRNLLRNLWNRRRDRRVVRRLPVRMADVEENMWELLSENLSVGGIRLRSDEVNIARLVAHRERVPLEIQLQEETAPVCVRPELLWTYPTASGGMMSGWRFARYEGNARRTLRSYLDQHEPDTVTD